ncbi:MEDIATOR OF RNA polymerase II TRANSCRIPTION SUBUNIT 4 [Salix koriyanagi]|uniref:Mediator of RNA polymerase II transcription subunit 4 n=1 Tax=Salix koriyanagi TaxID=2511006 RepID=A0A9Q0X5P2_9ROSI|nr:MEDIATOR OF RNA polymerase II TRANSCRIPTION SUBUNIT 4 [Salix koriyanagi]
MLQHQIVQSPARLGLTNPTSPSLPVQTPTPPPPKFPNPQPPQHHNPSTTTAATTTTTSSALLSLLPPLPRAQSLLLQMSQSLDEPTPSSTKEIISLFTSHQTQLFESVAELQEILDLQDAKQRVSQEIKSKESALLNFANKLKEAERVVDILVDDYADYRRRRPLPPNDEEENASSTTTVASQLKLSDILSYAHRISYTTFAPPEFDVETKEKTIEAIIEPQQEGNPLENLTGLFPPNISVPAGWKPGMPVVLPTDLPVPPPGWKPGDPVSLDSIPLPRTVEQKLPSIAPQGLHKPPETIQVRHVELDIPDQDDDSSDYSSDVESSDDED